MDYKDWISNRAYEIAEDILGCDYWELEEARRMQVWKQAEDDYDDYYSAKLDAQYDAWKDQQMDEKV